MNPFASLPTYATRAIGSTLEHGTRWEPAPADIPPALRVARPSFVTLERDGRLLGCVGSLTGGAMLAIGVAHHGCAAAFDDPRVPPVTVDDYTVMTVKVSVLSEPAQLTVADRDELARALRPKVDGLVVAAGRKRATFLPSVWAKLDQTDDFLDALWEKAGFPVRSWPTGLRVATYQAEEVVDPGPRQTLRVAPPG